MAFDPSEKRDDHGRWSRDGASGELPRSVIDPRVVDVSGDKWNRDTATRLEAEYAAVRPELDKIAVTAEGEESETHSAASSWEEVPEDVQTDAADKYYSANYDSAYDSEVESWHDGNDPVNEAKHALINDADFKEEWLADFIKERTDDDEERIPYTAQQLSDAIEIHADDDGGDPQIEFNDDFLSEPDNLNPNYSEDQLELPGIDAPKINGHDSLTEAMRDDIVKSLTKAFNKEAESKSSDVEPPEYVAESAKEYVQSTWDEMGDEDKYSWVKDNTSLLDDDEEHTESFKIEIPDKFDPLNLTSGEDYKRTQALAKYMSDHRAAQLITDRIGNAKWKPRDKFLGSDEDYEKLYGRPDSVGAKKDEAWTERMLEEVQSVDTKLWSGWKGSSTGMEGKILQVAAADELGGRLREAKATVKPQDDPLNDPAEIVAAKATMGDTGATETKTYFAKMMIKAYKAGAPTDVVKAYHALMYPGLAKEGPIKELPPSPEALKTTHDWEQSQKYNVADIDKTPIMKSETVNGYVRLPDVNITRNGAASTTISRDVANGWNGTTNYAPTGIDRKEVIEAANRDYKSIGGYEGVKAAIRAKWETTQYLLDRADIPVVQAYRGITMPHKLGDATEESDFNPPASGLQKVKSGDTVNLAESPVGTTIETQSGKTITKVSNEDLKSGYAPGTGQWKYSQRKHGNARIVLRAEVPRTAVVSVPAYGINIKSEQEVVVVGTAWRNWDAWSGRAPSFDEVPMGAATAAKESSKTDKEYEHLMKELDAV